MHVYRMQQLIKQRGKDRVVNIVQRNSIHQTVGRLARDGLIDVKETQRAPGRPQRTIYQITDEGAALFQQWMRDMLAIPAREFPEFPAALSFVGLTSCAEVERCLRARESELERRLVDIAPPEDDTILPRVLLIEDEYLRAMTEAELRWVRSVIGELGSGGLSWDTEELLSFVPPA